MRKQFSILILLVGFVLFLSTECLVAEMAAEKSKSATRTLNDPVVSDTDKDNTISAILKPGDGASESVEIAAETENKDEDIIKEKNEKINPDKREIALVTEKPEDETLEEKQHDQNDEDIVLTDQTGIENLSNLEVFLPTDFYFSIYTTEKIFVLASLRTSESSDINLLDQMDMGSYLDDDPETPITENSDESLVTLDDEDTGIDVEATAEEGVKETNLSMLEDESLEKELDNLLNDAISHENTDKKEPVLVNPLIEVKKDATDLALGREDSVESEEEVIEILEKGSKTIVQFGFEKTDILDAMIFDLIRSMQYDEIADFVSINPDEIIIDAYAELGALGTEKSNRVPEITVYQNKKVRAFIKMYTHRKRYVLIKAVERYAIYKNMIHRIFREHGVPLNLAYLAIVESNLNPKARSSANALGLWQFMSYTGKAFGLERSWWHDDRYDAEKSTVAAAKYLKRLNRQFKGNWELALAAYNSGSGTVRRAIRKNIKRKKPTDFWSLKLPRETRGYVPAFYAVATIFQDLDKYGFKPVPTLVDEVEKKHLAVAGGISLKDVAGVLKLDLPELKKLNPSLRSGGLSPATYETFQIAIPVKTNISFAQITKLNKLSLHPYDSWKTHIVRRGESLWSISMKYRVPMRKIVQFNRFKRKNLINIGQKLMLPIPKSWKPPVIRSKIEIVKDKLDKLPGLTLVYTIKKGDSLWKISTMFQIPVSTIKRWNRPILHRRFLKVGSDIVLKLPIPVTASST